MKIREIQYLADQVSGIAAHCENAFRIPPEPDLDTEIIKAVQNGTAKVRPSAQVMTLTLEKIACSCSSYGSMSAVPLTAVFKEPDSYREAIADRKQALAKKKKAMKAVRDKAQEIIDGVNLGQYDNKRWRQPINDMNNFIKEQGGTPQ